MLGVELMESAGGVVDVSAGAVDCCFEQATIANALKHNKRRLRFIGLPQLSPRWIAHNV